MIRLAVLLSLLACASTPREPLSNRAPSTVPAYTSPERPRLVCSWHFDWLGVVQVGGGTCR